MTLIETLARIKTILSALAYTAAPQGKVFAPDSVHVATIPGQVFDSLPRRFPRALIRVESDSPYGDHGVDLGLAAISIEVQQQIKPQTTGEVQIIDGNRLTTGATAGAGLARIVSKTRRALNFVDTNAAGTHSTWILADDAPSTPFMAEADVIATKLPYTALFEQEEIT